MQYKHDNKGILNTLNDTEEFLLAEISKLPYGLPQKAGNAMVCKLYCKMYDNIWWNAELFKTPVSMANIIAWARHKTSVLPYCTVSITNLQHRSSK